MSERTLVRDCFAEAKKKITRNRDSGTRRSLSRNIYIIRSLRDRGNLTLLKIEANSC